MNFEQAYVLDTNIILNDANNIFSISQNGNNLIILPETTIDELDSKKTGFDEINFQAREFGRILSEAEVISTLKVADDGNFNTIMRVKVKNDIIIDIISISNYNLDVDKSILNDRKIIKVADFATSYYKKEQIIEKEVVLLSLDVMCRTRAISLDVKTETLHNKLVDKEYDEFIKEIDIDSTLLNTLSNKDIRSIDPSYKNENFCYIFKAETGHQIPAVIVNERIELLDENQLRKHIVKPKNMGQLFAYYGMTNPIYNIVLIDALAGSGKTLLAVAAGMRNIDKGNYNKIIYVRNSIESVDKGEDIGYLPGLEEKFRIYNMPLYDTLEFIASQSLKDSKKEDEESVQAKVDELKAKYHIETCWPGEMRGRTFSNAFVIIDEMQNISNNTAQLILSRLDDNCKAICIGSNKQIDNMYINKYTNSMTHMLEEMSNKHDEVNLFATKLNKVVRGRITQFAERVFSKKS